MPKGTLYLVPTALGREVTPFLPPATLESLRRLRTFIVEDAKTARAFLKAGGYSHPLQSVRMLVLNEHTSPSDLAALLHPLENGEDCGLLSEAGCPCVADPGAELVRRAHAAEIRVVPLVGPSSLLLALMASGLNGQRFTFHGYLPVERGARAKKLQQLERTSEHEDSAQILIETPYRNVALLDAIQISCRDDTLLCVATDLTLPAETIRTLTVGQWKHAHPDLNRRPSVFVLYRGRRPTRKRDGASPT